MLVVVAAASTPTAGTRGRKPGGSGSRRRAYLVACLLAACILFVPAYVALVLPGGSGADAGDLGTGESGGGGATDRSARITFRLTGGALGMRLLRDAPPASMRVRGRRLSVVCGYRGAAGLTLLRRPLRWPAGSRIARLPLPARVLGSMEFCSLGHRGRGVARVVFA